MGIVGVQKIIMIIIFLSHLGFTCRFGYCTCILSDAHI